MTRLMITMVAAIAALWTVPAFATDILDGTVQLGPGNLTQSGRLVRGGVAQDFPGSETFPGTNNPSVLYHYAAFETSFAPNAFQDVYYLVTFDDDATDLFASVYNGSYVPLNKQQNWLGDAGSSGNYIFYPGRPGDARYFGVKVTRGGSLTLVVNDTVPGLGTSSAANYLVQAFSDVDYDENFVTAGAVPEPATWLMMVMGFGAVGWGVRRRIGKPRGAVGSSQ